ncbi:MAG: class I SAM-dependent methyltransferase [Christensenellaceae bacterium]
MSHSGALPSAARTASIIRGSVACSRKATKKYADRCSILCGDAMRLPYRDDTFDRAVSFESIYFWPDPVQGLKEMLRVLKRGGKIILASEMTDPEKGKFWAKRCEGMTIYTAEELAATGKSRVFDIKIHKTRKFGSRRGDKA